MSGSQTSPQVSQAEAAQAASLSAPLQEVFSSTQGEGPYVGRRQVFVRFAHCHLKCTYCDTPMTSADGKLHAETVPGGVQQEAVDNPVDVETLAGVIERLLAATPHHSVSFTGGEPLLYHKFLAELFPRIQTCCKTYLETSGTQPEFLTPVLPHTDIIAMDIKLPSATGEASQFANHRAFLEAARESSAEVFAKVVFNNTITDDEVAQVIELLQATPVPLILQPETSLEDDRVYVSGEKILALESRFSRTLDDVRVIPQTHKMVRVR